MSDLSEKYVITCDWGFWTGKSFKDGYRYPWVHYPRMIKLFGSHVEAEIAVSKFPKGIPNAQVRQLKEAW